jgi:serine/threonine protein kinase
VLDAFEDADYFYIVTEKYAALVSALPTSHAFFSWKEKLVIKKMYPESEVKLLIRQLVEALAYLHSNGIMAGKIELKVRNHHLCAILAALCLS